MAVEIFLIADAQADRSETAALLTSALAKGPVSALLVAAGPLDDTAYRDRVAALLPIAQAKNCAVLIDNRIDLVIPTQADGVHVTGGLNTLKDALAKLKPDYIVGTGAIGSRHEAMLRGELDVDYLMFGDRPETDGAEMANWWAETFEVPSVYCARAATDPALSALRAEFAAFAQKDWEDLQSRPSALDRTA